MKSFLILLSVILIGTAGCKPKREPVKLGGVKWELIELNGKEVVLSEPDAKIFMLFDENISRVNGRAACNRFFGDYTLTDTKFTFSPMGATRMACPNDSNWEAEFFKTMEIVDNLALKDEVLSFFSEESVVARFKKVPLEETPGNE